MSAEVDPLVRDQLASARARQTDVGDAIRSGLRRVVTFVAFLVLLALGYTGYKELGQAADDPWQDWPFLNRYLPRTDDLTMPPVIDILTEFTEPLREGQESLGRMIFDAALFTLREAAVGFAFGLLLGMAIAIILARAELAERAVLPYVIASQTVPLVALAPIIVIWGRTQFDFLPWDWQVWHSVSTIAVYLTFFPVAVNGLRGLKSPPAAEFELMRSYGASWTNTLLRLRLPASLPYLFPAFKIAGTASVVGAIVGEISSGQAGGLGRLILDFAGRYSTGPERLYASVLGAAMLGIFVVLLIAAVEWLVLTRRGVVPQ